MDNRGLARKAIFLFIILACICFINIHMGFNKNQIFATVAFSLTILGTILFWEFRLSFAFLGAALVLISGVASVEDFIQLASMEVIFFLIGMMIIVGFLREIGLFTYLLQRAIILKNISAKKMMVMLVITSALLACVVDEVSSIIFMIMIIFEFCDYFEIAPLPFIMASVLATNIGSTGTVIGNPIGIFIATKAQLTFEDFLIYSFPIMLLSLIVLTFLLFFIFRRALKLLDYKIKELGANEFLVRLLAVPPEKKLKIGMLVFSGTILFIATHHRFEVMLGLEPNTVLLMAPLVASAIIMVWRRDRARVYVERDVEWWTLLFFIFLFAQAGILAKTGVAETWARKLLVVTSGNKFILVPTILFGTAIVSSALDNIVVVAGFIPVLKSLSSILDMKHLLWWAFLFGACFGGNITIIGSTANIMALGTMERCRGQTIGFFYWFKIGAVVGFFTLIFALALLLFIPYYK